MKKEEVDSKMEKLRKKEIEFLTENRNKEFIITEDFYEAARKEFERSLGLGGLIERALITFCESNDSQVIFGNEVYPHSFLKKEGYITCRDFLLFWPDGWPKPDMWIKLDGKKFLKLAEEQGKFPYFVHTHPSGLSPSKGDLGNSPGILIGQGLLQEIKRRVGLENKPEIALFYLKKSGIFKKTIIPLKVG